jgi:hypothetical protein
MRQPGCEQVYAVRLTTSTPLSAGLFGESGVRIAARRIALGHESSKGRAMAAQELVQRIDQARRTHRFDQMHEWTSHTCLDKKRYSSATIARNRCAVAEDEPPTLAAILLGDRRE